MIESPARAAKILAGRRILVVEDEYLIADDIVRTLSEFGAVVVDAAPCVKSALAAIQSAPWLDAAVIDVKLASELSYPVAEALIARRTPFVFATIYRRDELPECYRDRPHCPKPMQSPVLLEQLLEALRRTDPIPPLGHDSDIALWILSIARTRDREAFGKLFIAVAPKVKGYMLRFGLAGSTAEDLAQDALLTVWRKAELFDPSRADAMAWIFTIARNLRTDLHRREHHGNPPPPDWTALSGPDTPEDLVGTSRDSRKVRAAMLTLPPAQAEVLRRSFLDGETHGEIASALNLPLGTVKSRLRLAMDRLRLTLGHMEH